MSRRSEEGVITVMSDSDDDLLTDYFKSARRRSLSPDLLTSYFGNRDWLSSKKQRVTSPAVPNVSSGSGPVVPAVPNVHSGSVPGLPVVPKVPSGSGTALPVVPKVPSGSGPGLPVVPKVPSGSGTVLPVSSGAMPKAPSGRISAVPKVLSGSSQPQGMRWGYNMRSCGRAAQQARPSAAPSDTAPSSASPPPAQPPSTAPPMPPSVLPAGPLELPPKEHERFMPMLGCFPMGCSDGAVELVKAAVQNTANSPKLAAMILAFLGSAKADSGDKQDDASNDSGGILLVVVVVFAIIGIVQTLKACKHRIKSMLCSTMYDKSVQTDACDTTLVAAAVPVVPEPVTATIRYRAYDTFSGMAYWTAGGCKFHVDPNCRAIAGNATMRSMAVCKICG
jgi:hypothetical protein